MYTQNAYMDDEKHDNKFWFDVNDWKVLWTSSFKIQLTLTYIDKEENYIVDNLRITNVHAARENDVIVFNRV